MILEIPDGALGIPPFRRIDRAESIQPSGQHLSERDLATITVSDVGLHVESADVDINAAGLLSHIGRKLARKSAKSF